MIGPPLLALALLLPGAALAHHPGAAGARDNEPHPPAGALAQARPDPALQEMQRERASPGVPPGVQAQRRAAEEAEGAELQGALAQLRSARAAIAARRYGQANEFLERAESRLLTRSTLATQAGAPLTGGAIGHLAAARAAVQRQDQAAALREVDMVLAMAARGGRRAQ